MRRIASSLFASFALLSGCGTIVEPVPVVSDRPHIEPVIVPVPAQTTVGVMPSELQGVEAPTPGKPELPPVPTAAGTPKGKKATNKATTTGSGLKYQGVTAISGYKTDNGKAKTNPAVPCNCK